MTTEQLAILLPPIAGVIVAFGVLIYAISYAVRTIADASGKRAEKERLAAEVAAKLADAVSLQLANLANEVHRLGNKLEVSEGATDGLERRNERLREGIRKDGSRETLDEVLKQDDRDIIDQQRKKDKS